MTRLRKHWIFGGFCTVILASMGFYGVALITGLLTLKTFLDWRGHELQQNWSEIEADAEHFGNVAYQTPTLKRALLEFYKMKNSSIKAMPVLKEDFQQLTQSLWNTLSQLTHQRAEKLTQALVDAWPTRMELNYNPVTLYSGV